MVPGPPPLQLLPTHQDTNMKVENTQHSEHDLSRSVQATVDEASTLYLFTLFF